MSRFGDPFDHFRDLFGEGFSRFKSNKEQQNIFHRQEGLQDNMYCTVFQIFNTGTCRLISHDSGTILSWFFDNNL
jgi:hypothetical protein